MTERPAIVVAGLGRCGTSLMMQMLHAGGVPCIGEWPAYETSASNFGSFDPVAFAALRGTAIKLIDPARLPIGAMPNHIVIWLERDPVEQAKSQVKMMQGFGAGVPANRKTIRTMVSGIRRDTGPSMAALGIRAVCPSIRIQFEYLLDPFGNKVAMAALVGFLSRHGYGDLDLGKMVGQIRRRSPECYPGMLEFELLDRKAFHLA